MSYDLLASQSIEVRKSCFAKNDKGAHRGGAFFKTAATMIGQGV